MKVKVNKDVIINIGFGILTVIVVLVIKAYLFQVCLVTGNSMNPTYYNSDKVLVSKYIKDYKQNDVIVFDHYGELFIKRVVGVPGDKIQIVDGIVYVNDVKYQTLNDSILVWSGIANDGIVLGDDEYFVLGDNYNDSKDSRDETVGPVNKNLILGKVVRKIM